MVRFFGYPVYGVIEEGLPGAVHAAEVVVIAGVNRLQTPKQKFLLCSLLLCSLFLCPLFLCSLPLRTLLLESFPVFSLYTKPIRVND